MPAAIVRLMYAPEVRDPSWRLHAQPGRAGRVGLVGWRTTRPSVGAGVPSEVGALVARALCRVASVSFLDASARDAGAAWEAFPGGLRRLLDAPGARPGSARALPLCCTSEPEV